MDMRIKNERGIALAITLLVIVVLITLGAVFVLRAVNEKSVSDHQRRMVKSFYIAEVVIDRAGRDSGRRGDGPGRGRGESQFGNLLGGRLNQPIGTAILVRRLWSLRRL